MWVFPDLQIVRSVVYILNFQDYESWSTAKEENCYTCNMRTDDLTVRWEKELKAEMQTVSMNSLQRFVILGSLLVGSAVLSLLFILGVTLSGTAVVRWVLYFPFYGVLFLSSVFSQLTGVRVLSPLLFLLGVVLTTVYVFILLEKMSKWAYLGMGALFFIFLLICGRAVFVRFIYVSQSTTLETAVYSVRIFLEFLAGLALVYLILHDVTSVSMDETVQE